MSSPTMHVVIQVRPKGAGPFYWANYIVDKRGLHPEDDIPELIEFCWSTVSVTIEKDDDDPSETIAVVTGHAVGYQPGESVAWQHVEAVIDAWFDAHDEECWLWEFRLVPLPTSTPD